MKKWMSGLALAVVLGAAAGIAEAQERDRVCGSDAALRMAAKSCDGTYGTKVSWLTDEKQAAEKARAGNRLVMVVHISGELDDPEKT